MLKKKSIVLSDLNGGSNKKAVLTLEEDGIGLHGTLRLYNFTQQLSGILSLGFYVDKKVYKSGLTMKANMLYDFYLSLQGIPNKFSCAVVNFQNAEATPILYGTSEGCADDIYGSIVAEISNDNSLQNTKKVLDSYGVDFDDEEKAVIEKEIDAAMCSQNCANCEYKKFFFENAGSVESLAKEEKKEPSKIEEPRKEEKKEEVKTENEILFFDKLKPQIDKLFEDNPVEDSLQTLIPSSKWVKVDYENDGDFYVFGLLYDEDGSVRYVCYGVPAVFEEEPPKELAGYPIWLPLNKNNKEGFGYWLTYQDASTGEPVKAIME